MCPARVTLYALICIISGFALAKAQLTPTPPNCNDARACGSDGCPNNKVCMLDDCGVEGCEEDCTCKIKPDCDQICRSTICPVDQPCKFDANVNGGCGCIGKPDCGLLGACTQCPGKCVAIAGVCTCFP